MSYSMKEYIFYTECKCGALTFFFETDKKESYSVSVHRKNTGRFGLQVDKTKLLQKEKYSSCDRCSLNKYGPAMCACGSGLAPAKCGCKNPKPSQSTKMLEEGYELSEWVPNRFVW